MTQLAISQGNTPIQGDLKIKLQVDVSSRLGLVFNDAQQRRFYQLTCRDEDSLKRCVDSLPIDPGKHRLVSRVMDGPWSSFHRSVRLGDYPGEWGSADHWYGDELQCME